MTKEQAPKRRLRIVVICILPRPVACCCCRYVLYSRYYCIVPLTARYCKCSCTHLHNASHDLHIASCLTDATLGVMGVVHRGGDSLSSSAASTATSASSIRLQLQLLPFKVCIPRTHLTRPYLPAHGLEMLKRIRMPLERPTTRNGDLGIFVLVSDGYKANQWQHWVMPYADFSVVAV